LEAVRRGTGQRSNLLHAQGRDRREEAGTGILDRHTSAATRQRENCRNPVRHSCCEQGSGRVRAFSRINSLLVPEYLLFAGLFAGRKMPVPAHGNFAAPSRNFLRKHRKDLAMPPCRSAGLQNSLLAGNSPPRRQSSPAIGTVLQVPRQLCLIERQYARPTGIPIMARSA
jgi:hypothetical protein